MLWFSGYNQYLTYKPLGKNVINRYYCNFSMSRIVTSVLSKFYLFCLSSWFCSSIKSFNWESNSISFGV